MKVYFNLIKNFKAWPSLCNLLQLMAYDTWRRIEFARTRNGLKIFETTITQNILYEFRLYGELFPQIPIRMFEAINEPLNGNDIELVIQTKEGFILAPLQAKLIYKTHRYNSMEHGNQIRDLISYAKRIGGIPLYLLYNFYPDQNFLYTSNLCGVRFSKEQYGCSLVSAYYLLNKYAFNRTDRNSNVKWTIPSFTDLHPQIAIPWFVLGCCRFPSIDKVATINLLNNFPASEIKSDIKTKIYALEELTREDNWKPFDINGLNFSSNDSERNDTIFSPKYRIVLFTDNESSNKRVFL